VLQPRVKSAVTAGKGVVAPLIRSFPHMPDRRQCGAEGVKLRHCQACKAVSYCSRECQAGPGREP
jgi:hypothetical protein